ncbi:MAG: hypothetical protein HN849_05530, partial [Victivallales bacterium]|nr:hypothetical protein [Victivallales bacterium]
MRIRWPAGLLLVCLSLGAAEFVSQWPEGVARPWVGESMWANRLQDWRVADGWLECVADGADAFRTVHLLTHRLQKTGAAFSTSVTVRLRAGQGTVRPDAVAGFLVGVGKDEMDYRAAALVQGWPGNGAGVFAGVGPDGKPVQFVAIRTDITEGKRMNLALESANHELESFYYSVSHDLR